MKHLIIFSFLVSTFLNTNAQTFKKGETWTGYYECVGNNLDFKLTIDEVQNDIIKSRFIFLNGLGEFEMIGKYSNNEFTFLGTKWINNPNDGYVTLGLHGFYMNSPDRLIGNTISKLTFTEGNECTGFYLSRIKQLTTALSIAERVSNSLKKNQMKKIYLGILALSIISILSAFSISNNEYKKADDRCGCVNVDKKSISQNNKLVEYWYEKVCGRKCGTCAYGYHDKWNAKNELQTKYDKMYSGTDFKVTLYWVSDSNCE